MQFDQRIFGALIATLIATLSGAAYAAPIVISSIYDLQNIQNDLTADYVLANDIDASATAQWTWEYGTGFKPIGIVSSTTPGAAFTGKLDGSGHTISNLHIEVGVGAHNVTGLEVGLFADLGSTAVVSNLNLNSIYVARSPDNWDPVSIVETGTLAGTNAGTIKNVSVSGTVSSGFGSLQDVGGLVGFNTGVISYSFSSASVQSSGSNFVQVGGLVAINNGQISQSASTGAVVSASLLCNGCWGGGLVGLNNSPGTISQSYSHGSISASEGSYGALVGGNASNISESYATGWVSVSSPDTNLGQPIPPTYPQHVGGLVGFNGGYFGSPLGTVTNSYWDTQTTGQPTSTAGVPLTTADFKSGTLPVGFDTTIWVTQPGTYPTLSANNVLPNFSPPSVSELALLSVDSYRGVPLGASDYTLVGSRTFADGLFIRAYATPDKSQVVFAIRGTDPSDWKNLIVDAAIALTTTSPLMNNYILEATTYLNEIVQAYPNAHISLTGHSLGGALAQMLGKASGGDTVVFDAPGASEIYQIVGGSLAQNLPLLGNSILNANYRHYGDQVSAFGNEPGKQLGIVLTVDTVGGPITSSEFLNGVNVISAHSIDTLASKLQPGSGTSISLGIDGPNFGGAILSSLLPSQYQNLNTVLQVVSAYEHYFGDPVASGQFFVFGDPGSPLFASLELPTLSGVAYYGGRYQSSSLWTDFGYLLGGTTFNFIGGANAFEFGAFDASGIPFVIAEPFFFDVTFLSDGEFSGQVLTIQAPEPSPLPLLGCGIIMLFILRRTKYAKTHRQSLPCTRDKLCGAR